MLKETGEPSPCPVCSVADRGDVSVSIVGIEEIEIALQVGQEKHPLVPPLSTHRTVPCATCPTFPTQNYPC